VQLAVIVHAARIDAPSSASPHSCASPADGD